MAKNPHRWKFHRVVGLDQVSIATGDDLTHLDKLDQKLWTALSCPTRGLELDPRTLDLLDGDGDGRVRAPDLLAAVAWCQLRLKDMGTLVNPTTDLALAALDLSTPEGKALHGAARQLLAALERPDATTVTPADVADVSHVFDGTDFNGDGVIPAEAAGADAVARQLAVDAMACAGSAPDRSGRPGVDGPKLEAFFDELAAVAAWWALGEGPATQTLGPATPAAWTAVEAVRTRVDDFFTRCQVAALDPRAGAFANRSDAELATSLSGALSAGSAELRALPLARIEPGRALPLGEGVNPAWAAAVAALAADAVTPALGQGRTSLSAAEWTALGARLAPYGAWFARRPAGKAADLGIARVQELLGGDARARVEALLEKDRALEPEARAIADVVRMVHYHRDLLTLVRNFVSFTDFYDPSRPAVFQAGTLYLDARSADLCVRVEDPTSHAALATVSRMYLAYCECRRKGEAMKIVACFTQGDSDYLTVGRNGVFYDRKGRDWDATVVRIVENPISIRQAFFAPYKKFVRMIEEQVARFAAAKDKEAEARLEAAASGTVGHATQAKPIKAEPVDVGRMVGIIAAIGVGAGALGTLLGGLVSGFLGLEPWWAKLVAVLGAFAAISGPSVVIAWLKLRQRTLGPVLDANGWAVNARVKVNLPLGTALTQRATLPSGASRSLKDPYEDRGAARRRRLFWLLVVAVAAALGAAKYLHVWPFAPLR
jgi:hypothetical protein